MVARVGEMMTKTPRLPRWPPNARSCDASASASASANGAWRAVARARGPSLPRSATATSLRKSPSGRPLPRPLTRCMISASSTSPRAWPRGWVGKTTRTTSMTRRSSPTRARARCIGPRRRMTAAGARTRTPSWLRWRSRTASSRTRDLLARKAAEVGGAPGQCNLRKTAIRSVSTSSSRRPARKRSATTTGNQCTPAAAASSPCSMLHACGPRNTP
mmetsp:Transcript_27166/g.73155  ORF Transcript_27166/g.73155 Transcript_27166/m.73155 type:complete len:217 (-) Transcript_27166:234-884(-)